MKPSLVDVLEAHLKFQYPSWVSKGVITAREWKQKNGTAFLPETVGRKLRELEDSKRIAVKDEGVSVAYKWLPEDMRARYIPKSMRLRGEENKLFTA